MGRIAIGLKHSQELVPHELSLQLLIPRPGRHKLVLRHCKQLVSKSHLTGAYQYFPVFLVQLLQACLHVLPS